MRQVLPLCLALALLSACNNDYKPVELPMTDLNVLSGQWQGQLAHLYSLDPIHSTASRVYVRDGQNLEAYDLQSGKRLAQQPLPAPSSQVAWRADGALLSLVEGRLTQHDAGTLAPLSVWTLPITGNDFAWSLSSDGETVLYSDGTGGSQTFSTRTRQRLTLAALPQGRVVATQSSDARWAVLGLPGLPPSGPRPLQVQNRVDGRQFEIPARTAPAGCDVSDSARVRLEAVKTTAGEERLLIVYPDGLVQVRSAAGQLLRDIALWPCQGVKLRAIAGQPGSVTYSVGTPELKGSYGAFTLGEVGLLNVASGQQTQRYAVKNTGSVTEFAQPTAAGFLAVTRTTVGAGPAPNAWRFQTWAGQTWNFAPAQYTLKLDLTTTRVSDTEARTAGTAVLNGRTLNVSGQITTLDLTLKAQARAFSPSLRTTLNLMDGQTGAGRLELFNNLKVGSVEPPVYDPSRTPSYTARYLSADGNDAMGEVTRP